MQLHLYLITSCVVSRRFTSSQFLAFCKGKVFPAAILSRPGRLRLRIFLDFRYCEGGKVVTPTHRPPLPPGVFWYSLLEAESTPEYMVLSVASEKIPSDTTGDRSHDSPTSSAVPLTTTLPQPSVGSRKLKQRTVVCGDHVAFSAHLSVCDLVPAAYSFVGYL